MVENSGRFQRSMLTIADAAKYASVARGIVEHSIYAGRLRFVKVDGVKMVAARDLRHLLRGRGNG
jgi:hypothetical protein